MFQLIVVATDGSESGDLAVAFARDLATEQTSRMVVVHVDQLVPGHGGAHHTQVLEPEIRTKIEDQVSALRTGGLDVELKVHQTAVHGPAHEIADDAKAEKADLIVVGSVGSGPLRGLLLGSVAHRLLQIAPCPVLVVPKADR